MEDIDYKNREIPEEVAPYAKSIFAELRNTEVNIKIFFLKFIRKDF